MSTPAPAPGSAIARALAEVQRQAPRVRRSSTAHIRSAKGSYQFRYAGLGEVSRVVLPLFGANGLSVTVAPDVDDGQFVARWTLRHVDGEQISGVYPLPAGTTAQSVAGWITSVRRMVLAGLSGLAAPDDDEHAEHADREHAHDWPQPDPPAARPSKTNADAYRAKMRRAAKQNRWNLDAIAALYAELHNGADYWTEADARRLREFEPLAVAHSDRLRVPTPAEPEQRSAELKAQP